MYCSFSFSPFRSLLFFPTPRSLPFLPDVFFSHSAICMFFFVLFVSSLSRFFSSSLCSFPFFSRSRSLLFFSLSRSLLFFSLSRSLLFFSLSRSLLFFSLSRSLLFFSLSRSLLFFSLSLALCCFSLSLSLFAVFLSLSRSLLPRHSLLLLGSFFTFPTLQHNLRC
ncbi:unnamed protein product [Acanthosepion pharaonis]|uniref:Uncharacterized protein n=1 Tax=Acanthosepion pharaonis TaxID=158019 RepID=A0A812DK40_ACAPH|nr:unnamed protein product [Sepia pharaonis]